MATSRINIGGKFQNTDIPSQDDFKEIFDSFVHKDEDKANFQMVETGTDDQHYVTPALLRTGLQNIGIITGNSYMPFKEHFDNFIGNTLPLRYSPVKFSAKAFKNGQLLLEKDLEGNEGDYIINYDTAVITFSSDVDNRNIEVDYWYKNLSPNPGGGSTPQIDFTSFLHTSGNETKNGLLTFNNTTPTSTSGIVLTNSGAGSAATSLDVTNSGTGSGISLQNSSTGTGVKVSNSGAGVAVNLNSATGSTGDILQVAKNNVVQTKIDSAGTITAPKFVTAGGLRSQFIKGDGFPDPTVYAEDTKVIHTEGNELRDGALNLTHDDAVQDVLTITKNNSANCLKLVQNSSSNATTSTFDTTTENVNRKAISVQKVHVEKAFITHEGNISGTSFTTLNEKADITDGFLTLAGSDSPAAMSGHAKLYAKTDGTTDMYVMGSDGIEKKIGGSSDITGTTDKLVKFNSTGHNFIDSNITDDGSLVTVSKPTLIDSGTNDNSGLTLSRISNSSEEVVIVNGFGNSSSTVLDVTKSYAYSTDYNQIWKINIASGEKELLPLTGMSVASATYGNHICRDNYNNLYITSSDKIYKINSSNVVSLFATVPLYSTDIIFGIDNNLYVINIWGSLTKITLDGIVSNIVNNLTVDTSIAQDKAGNFYVAGTNYKEIYKVTPQGVSTLFFTAPETISTLLLKDANTLYLFYTSGGGWEKNICELNLSTATLTPYENTSFEIANKSFLDSNGNIYIQSYGQLTKIKVSDKVLKTDSTGLVVKTTYLEDVQYLRASEINLANLVTGNNIKTVNGKTLLGSGDIQVDIPSHIEYNINDLTLWNNGAGNISTNTSFGDGALKVNSTGFQNTALGTSTLPSNTTGYGNTAIGFEALKNNTTGFYNIAVGNNTMEAATTGNTNIAMGAYALNAAIDVSSSIAIGMASMERAVSGDMNIAIGNSSLRSYNTGSENIAIGYNSLGNNTSGKEHTAVGTLSLWSNTTGNGNTAFGYHSLVSTTIGSNNVACGRFSLGFNQTGSENVAIGYTAGHFWGGGTSNPNIDSNNSVYIGSGASGLAAAGFNEIVIGSSAIGAGSNTATIGATWITKTILHGQVSGGSFKINSMNSAPASATAIGTTGEIRFTASAIYVCIATNTWVKSALTTW